MQTTETVYMNAVLSVMMKGWAPFEVVDIEGDPQIESPSTRFFIWYDDNVYILSRWNVIQGGYLCPDDVDVFDLGEFASYREAFEELMVHDLREELKYAEQNAYYDGMLPRQR